MKRLNTDDIDVDSQHLQSESIEDYCQRHALSLGERLNLFISACETVQNAHQRQIICRHLSTDNIRVNTAGRIKVLCPDTAVVSTSADGSSRAATAAAFAAPEQITGGPLTAATDIYALGIVLYRLLTGQHPYQYDADDPAALAEAICEHRPAPPSSLVDEPLSTHMSHGLDDIVLRTLNKNPAERQPSARTLAVEIGRYLQLEQPDHEYQTERRQPFVGRTILVAALAALGSVVVGVGLMQYKPATTTRIEQPALSVQTANKIGIGTMNQGSETETNGESHTDPQQ